MWDEYKYYPDQFFEPYLTRRRANGFGLYGALGIGRREVDRCAPSTTATSSSSTRRSA